jgi:hypothetical protein
MSLAASMCFNSVSVCARLFSSSSMALLIAWTEFAAIGPSSATVEAASSVVLRQMTRPGGSATHRARASLPICLWGMPTPGVEIGRGDAEALRGRILSFRCSASPYMAAVSMPVFTKTSSRSVVFSENWQIKVWRGMQPRHFPPVKQPPRRAWPGWRAILAVGQLWAFT